MDKVAVGKRRVFVGVPFDQGAKREIDKILKKLRRKHWPVRWEKVEKLHLTLAFLGWVSPKQAEEIFRATKKGVVGVGSFSVSFKGLGGFPDLVLPRIIWVGLKGDLKSLVRLSKRVRQELENVGFVFEKRPFVSHVTLGRVRREAGRKVRREMGRQISKMLVVDIRRELSIDRVVVYESRLSRRGSVYSELETVNLR